MAFFDTRQLVVARFFVVFQLFVAIFVFSYVRDRINAPLLLISFKFAVGHSLVSAVAWIIHMYIRCSCEIVPPVLARLLPVITMTDTIAAFSSLFVSSAVLGITTSAAQDQGYCRVSCIVSMLYGIFFSLAGLSGCFASICDAKQIWQAQVAAQAAA